MSKYIIFTDATTDLTAELADQLELQVLPMRFHLESQEYLNDLSHSQLSPKNFYQKLRNGSLPTTSQINPDQYIQAITPFLKKGFDILILSFSSALSSTYQSGVMATKELKELFTERQIEIFDTKAASMGEGLLVYLAAQKRLEGKNMDEVLSFVKETHLNVCHWFTVDDIKHLRRGGRVSAFSSIVAQTLNIKPVLHVDNSGKLIPRFKIIGRKKALRLLVEKMKESAFEGPQTVFLSHGDDIEAALYVKTLIEENFEIKDFVINEIGPVVGSHSGAGTIALFFLGKER